jgi:hypothetical protein
MRRPPSGTGVTESGYRTKVLALAAMAAAAFETICEHLNIRPTVRDKARTGPLKGPLDLGPLRLLTVTDFLGRRSLAIPHSCI